MRRSILYTVVFCKKTFRVRYAMGPAYDVVGTFGRFDDPGEASQWFQISLPGDHEYVDEMLFALRVAERARDVSAFNAWQQWASR